MRIKATLPALLALGTLMPAGLAWADEDLYRSKNCMACHRVDRNTLGPSFKNIANRYAEDKAAESKLAQRIQQGGAGVWGQVPMPAQPQVNDAEALTLARWILTLK